MTTLLRIAITGLIACLPLCNAAAEKLEFWSGASEGMNEGEIRSLFPAATVPDDPERLISGNLDHFRYVGTEALRDCTVKFHDHDACARFYFEKGRLVGVDIKIINLDRAQPVATASLEHDIRQALSAQLDAAPTCEEYKASQYRGASSFCSWVSGKQLVRLNYSHGLLPDVSSNDEIMMSITFRRNPGKK